MTTIDELARTTASRYEIEMPAARDLVTTYVDQISDDADLWDRAANELTEAGAEMVNQAIEDGRGVDSTGESLMLEELETIARTRTELDGRRDELVRSLMGTSVARQRIADAAGLKVARLYQIRDGRR